MNKIKDFLKAQAKWLTRCLICVLCFILVFFVFELNKEALWIGLGLVIFFFIIFFMVDYSFWQKENKLLQELKEAKQTIKDITDNNRAMTQERESFFLTWVHQIKPPLTSARLLLEDSSDENSNLVKTNLTEIENYTNLALSYLRVENPESDLRISRVKLDDIISPILKKYWYTFYKVQTKLHYEKIEDIVVTDASLTKLMVEQIINNALKYASGCDIWIDYDSLSKTLSIRDNGIGIKAEDQELIFQKGYSGFNGQLTNKSSGIGLFIAQSIAKRLNQPLSLESTYQEGSNFMIKFPNDD